MRSHHIALQPMFTGLSRAKSLIFQKVGLGRLGVTYCSVYIAGPIKEEAQSPIDT